MRAVDTNVLLRLITRDEPDETARKTGHLPLGTFHGNLGKVTGAQKL